MKPPRWFLKRLKALDADLGVEWLPREKMWAIVQKLWNTPSLETVTRRTADDALVALAKQGKIVARPQLERAIYIQVARRSIVLRVEERDGTPLPLDQRTLRRLEIMAYYRRNRYAKDWIAASDNELYEAKLVRERAIANIWEDVRRDKVFEQCVSDMLHGLQPRYHVGGPLPEGAAA